MRYKRRVVLPSPLKVAVLHTTGSSVSRSGRRQHLTTHSSTYAALSPADGACRQQQTKALSSECHRITGSRRSTVGCGRSRSSAIEVNSDLKCHCRPALPSTAPRIFPQDRQIIHSQTAPKTGGLIWKRAHVRCRCACLPQCLS